MKRIVTISLSVALLLTVSSIISLAMSSAKEAISSATAQNSKPKVVIIRADWCTACQKLEPTMMGLMQEYGSKLDFIMLDVTNDETTAQAAAKAKSLGLSAFFEANKKTTSTVAVFKGKRNIFTTAKNFNRDDYVNAFNKAVE